MYLTDFHLHSKYSPDGREEVREIAERAVLLGLSEICLTDHVDIYEREHPEPGHAQTGLGEYRFILGQVLDMQALCRDVEEAREEFKGKLKIRLGIELGSPQANPAVANAFLAKWPVDFIIGSIHTMANDEDLFYYDFAKMDVEAFFHAYLQREIELAKDYDYDVIGHCTYPLRYLVERGFPLDMRLFMEELRELFKIVIERGKGIEFNVAGICRATKVLLPEIPLIKEYFSLGGEILTIGSDAHILDHVGAPIREGMNLLKDAGIRYITTFEGRKPVFREI
ncbi:MAG: histidinol-phosphatase HisJ family protein [Lachnospiraceae bacterium]|nr:histidinol-phosphatase HisJ family protein [Lachnospiraceae bacterium]